MHGRVKVRTTEEQKLLKEKENQKKLVAYKKGMTYILSTRSKDTYDSEAFILSAKILLANPHIYTLWNYRKEVLLLEKEKYINEEKEFIYILEKELDFIEQCIINSPKCYSSWHHRYWLLKNHPMPNWNKEFSLCSKYLSVDDRNFHCWDYRRLVLGKTDLCLEKELAFSTERLNVNFSNYSSWHYRSTLRDLDGDSLENELILVQNAVFTDPYDSSAWFYFKWILNHKNILKEKRKEVLDSLKQLEELEPDCKWILLAKCWIIDALCAEDESHADNRIEFYDKLVKIDPLRSNRYLDEIKKLCLETREFLKN